MYYARNELLRVNVYEYRVKSLLCGMSLWQSAAPIHATAAAAPRHGVITLWPRQLRSLSLLSALMHLWRALSHARRTQQCFQQYVHCKPNRMKCLFTLKRNRITQNRKYYYKLLYSNSVNNKLNRGICLKLLRLLNNSLLVLIDPIL